jgi:hypothetical protein
MLRILILIQIMAITLSTCIYILLSMNASALKWGIHFSDNRCAIMRCNRNLDNSLKQDDRLSIVMKELFKTKYGYDIN